MDRRTSIKWVLAASATLPLWASRAASAAEAGAAACARGADAAAPAAGYGTDPDLWRRYRAGELWPLTLTAAQRRTAAALCDLIIPRDAESPSASAVGVVDFIDEWVSAPYPQPQEDRPVLLEGLAWLDGEAERRFARPFASLSEMEQRAIGDDICHAPTAQPRFADAAVFFARYRDLTVGGFYTTPQGRSDLGYLGNVPRASFEGPPRELLARLGLPPELP
jgi:hypothetical protein